MGTLAAPLHAATLCEVIPLMALADRGCRGAESAGVQIRKSGQQPKGPLGDAMPAALCGAGRHIRLVVNKLEYRRPIACVY